MAQTRGNQCRSQQIERAVSDETHAEGNEWLESRPSCLACACYDTCEARQAVQIECVSRHRPQLGAKCVGGEVEAAQPLRQIAGRLGKPIQITIELGTHPGRAFRSFSRGTLGDGLAGNSIPLEQPGHQAFCK